VRSDGREGRGSRGYESMTLNVWGGNDVARGLYRSLGYVEESVHMRERV
jgi:ribosomal protein S18 acetylase RimI-like enzyme